jgi:integrase
MRAIDAYPFERVRYAMQFSAFTFCRPGEIRQAEWREIDLNKKEWVIAEEKMKMRRQHIVPLSCQALEVLQEMTDISGGGKYVFPSNRTPARPMSDASILAALRAMGYTKEQMVPHGFRSMASTLLNENGFNRDWIERQLAHVEGNSVRAAYNYAEYLPERRKMMQWWADYLDKLRENA